MTRKDFVLNGLRIRLCQMKVVPGRPDINAQYVIAEIKKAIADGVDLIIFPEMCIPGYMIGDMPEDDAFIADIQEWNIDVCLATRGSGIIAIFGSILSNPDMKGEDGRLLKHNAAFVVQRGSFVSALGGGIIEAVIKSLHPKYRIFDDSRHYVSSRKLVGKLETEFKSALESVAEFSLGLFPQRARDLICDGFSLRVEDLLKPIVLDTRLGKLILLLIICEDGWDEDYEVKVLKILLEKARQIEEEFAVKGIPVMKLGVDISCSPWSWQKNRKRNKVMSGHLAEGDLHLAYVNNTGIQNNGKNIIIFDGSSTVYGPFGEIVFEIPPYVSGSHDIVITDQMPPVKQEQQDDTAELCAALDCAAGEMWEMLPKHMRKIVIPVSGGIDSSVSAADWSSVFGPENTYLVGLPSEHNDDELNQLAIDLANNLGANYETISIQELFEITKTKCGVTDSDEHKLTRQNIQPKHRMIIASTIAQRVGGVFPCNSNKVETFFGYGTRYGDIAGFVALYGDLIKREIYQRGDFNNKVRYRREVIPAKCFTIAPTAALEPGQKDPFDYGNLDRRGFHDELVRAVTEFRKNPEWFLENYLLGDLEQLLKLNPGHLKTLFPTAQAFVDNIEWSWRLFYESYSKRVQAPPIPIVSKRAFGYDLRESMVSPYFTRRYYELKRALLSK